MSPAHIPDSPTKPLTTIPNKDIDKDVKKMDAGDEANAVFGSAASSVAPVASGAELMGQHTAGNVDQSSQYSGLQALVLIQRCYQ